jgi:hypothetical protein
MLYHTRPRLHLCIICVACSIVSPLLHSLTRNTKELPRARRLKRAISHGDDCAPNAALAPKGRVGKVGRVDTFSEHQATGAAGQRTLAVAGEHRPAIAADPHGI